MWTSPLDACRNSPFGSSPASPARPAVSGRRVRARSPRVDVIRMRKKREKEGGGEEEEEFDDGHGRGRRAVHCDVKIARSL